MKSSAPYHRWLFDNRGNLMNAPGSDHFPESFRKEDFGLRSLRSAEFLGLIFATFDAAAPTLDCYLGDVRPYLETALHKDGRLNLLGYQKVVFASNWKEYNDQEGYHAPLLHRAFRLLGWQGGQGTRCVTEYGHMAVDAELQRMANIGFLHDASLVEVSGSNVKPRSVVITLFPLTQVLKHLDVHTIRFAHPLSPHETEVHYTYFCHADDDEEMVRHRLRQSSNLLGPSGLISLEDGAVFNRLHKGLMTPGTIAFHRGVNGRLTPPCVIGQNDEAGNLVKWERYRDLMDFERD